MNQRPCCDVLPLCGNETCWHLYAILNCTFKQHGMNVPKLLWFQSGKCVAFAFYKSRTRAVDAAYCCSIPDTVFYVADSRQVWAYTAATFPANQLFEMIHRNTPFALFVGGCLPLCRVPHQSLLIICVVSSPLRTC